MWKATIKLSLLLVLALLSANRGPGLGSQKPNSEQVAAIDSYAKRVDQFIKRNPNHLRIFANVASNKPDRWREFKSERSRDKADTGDNLNENAYVWLKAGKIVGVNFTFQSGSRDWAHFVMYYFREDGTLAKIQAQLNTFYGNVSIARDKFYSADGKMLRSTTRYLDLKSKKPTEPTADFQDEPIPIYRNVRDLPFRKLL